MTTNYTYDAYTATQETRGLSITSMVLGIVAWAITVLSFGLLSLIGMILAFVSIGFGLVGNVKEPHALKTSNAGLYLSGIYLWLWTLMWTLGMVYNYILAPAGVTF